MMLANPLDNRNAAQLPQLTPRQREVLRVLVQEYVATATPVASGTLRRVGDLGVSSATLRSELPLLESWAISGRAAHFGRGACPRCASTGFFVGS